MRPNPGPEIRYTTMHQEGIRHSFYPHLQDIFPSREWIRCFLSIIWHNGSIEPHQDTDTVPDSQRCHLVLQTNPDCWMLHDGTWQQLQEDKIYTMDPRLFHASINWGHEPRVFFVVDVAHGAPAPAGETA
jgi:hypothetical protein